MGTLHVQVVTMSAVRAFCMAIGREPVHIFDFDMIALEPNAFNWDEFMERFFQV
jgi:hypothetical protein